MDIVTIREDDMSNGTRDDGRGGNKPGSGDPDPVTDANIPNPPDPARIAVAAGVGGLIGGLIGAIIGSALG
jgi:hypothetical protein